MVIADCRMFWWKTEYFADGVLFGFKREIDTEEFIRTVIAYVGELRMSVNLK